LILETNKTETITTPAVTNEDINGYLAKELKTTICRETAKTLEIAVTWIL